MGFGVPVVDLLSTPFTPACALPARPCADSPVKAYALTLLQERFVSNPKFIGVFVLFTTTKFLAKKIPERVGFEPTVPLRVHTTSNRAPSAARSSLQYYGAGGIRTPGALASSMVFETISFNHSDTAPINHLLVKGAYNI